MYFSIYHFYTWHRCHLPTLWYTPMWTKPRPPAWLSSGLWKKKQKKKQTEHTDSDPRKQMLLRNNTCSNWFQFFSITLVMWAFSLHTCTHTRGMQTNISRLQIADLSQQIIINRRVVEESLWLMTPLMLENAKTALARQNKRQIWCSSNKGSSKERENLFSNEKKLLGCVAVSYLKLQSHAHSVWLTAWSNSYIHPSCFFVSLALCHHQNKQPRAAHRTNHTLFCFFYIEEVCVRVCVCVSLMIQTDSVSFLTYLHGHAGDQKN